MSHTWTGYRANTVQIRCKYGGLCQLLPLTAMLLSLLQVTIIPLQNCEYLKLKLRWRTVTVLHCPALPCTALHCTALHCTELSCAALRSTAPEARVAGEDPLVLLQRLPVPHLDGVVPQAGHDLGVVILQAVDALAVLAAAVDPLQAVLAASPVVLAVHRCGPSSRQRTSRNLAARPATCISLSL
jgi:hypothetical protein